MTLTTNERTIRHLLRALPFLHACFELLHLRLQLLKRLQRFTLMQRRCRADEEVEEEADAGEGRDEEDATKLREERMRAAKNVACREEDEKNEKSCSAEERHLHAPENGVLAQKRENAIHGGEESR